MTDWYRRRARENEAGAILIIYTLILTTMIALTGFAVDFTRWSRIGTMEQRAADAAALAGAVYMPDDFSGAQTAALAQASKNGFTNGQNNTTITVARGVRSNQLRVTISHQVTNFFGNIVGVKFTTIKKEALAEYQRSVNMGSPSNQFGNNPEASTFNSTTYPNFWGSIAGPSTDKVQGDAISSQPCASSGTGASDNCSSSLNSEYDAKGYFYGVDVIAGATGTLTIPGVRPGLHRGRRAVRLRHQRQQPERCGGAHDRADPALSDVDDHSRDSLQHREHEQVLQRRPDVQRGQRHTDLDHVPGARTR